MGRSVATAGWLVATWLGVAACGGRGDAEAAASHREARRDSAGVTIVEHLRADSATRAPATRPPPSWALGAPPLVSLGAVPGDTAHELFDATSARRLADGRVAVGLRSIGEVRLFDAAGGLVRTIGRPGSGPGEFTSVNSLWPAPDGRIAVWDVRRRSLSVFDTSGSYLRSRPLGIAVHFDSSMLIHGVVGILDDGAVVTLAGRRVGEEGVGLLHSLIHVALVDSSGGVRRGPGPFRGQETYVSPPKGGYSALGRSPFARNTLVTARHGLIAVAPNDRYEVTVVDPDGTVRLVLRGDVEGASITERDYELATGLEKGDPGFDETVRHLREITSYDRMPVLGALHYDAAGTLWVEEFLRPGAPARRVSAYDPTGARLGDVDLPAAMELLAVEPDAFVVRVRAKDDDTERVLVYAVEPGARGGVRAAGAP